MSDEAPERPGRTWMWMAGLLMGLPVCYVLSSGPAVVLYHRGVVSLDRLQTAYAPLDWLDRQGFREPLYAYVQAWMTLTGTPRR